MSLAMIASNSETILSYWEKGKEGAIIVEGQELGRSWAMEIKDTNAIGWLLWSE